MRSVLLIHKVNGMADSNACRFCSQTACSKMNRYEPVINRRINFFSGEITLRSYKNDGVPTFSINIRDSSFFRGIIAVCYHTDCI
jgi:hypothetical protein